MEGRKGKWSPEAGGAEAVKIYLALPCYINMSIREDTHIEEEKNLWGIAPTLSLNSAQLVLFVSDVKIILLECQAAVM